MSVILHFTTSLDGFIEDDDGSLDWAFGYDSTGEFSAVAPEADRVMRGAGVVISGRRGFDADGGKSRPYGGAWAGRMFILSHRPPPADAHEDFHFLDVPIAEAIRIAKEAAEAGDHGADVLIFSADIARQALDAGLVDEVLLHIVPLVLGSGVRLFDGLAAPVRLETRLTAQSGQVTTMLFGVRR